MPAILVLADPARHQDAHVVKLRDHPQGGQLLLVEAGLVADPLAQVEHPVEVVVGGHPAGLDRARHRRDHLAS